MSQHKKILSSVNLKYLEAKDVVDIAIVYQVFSKQQLLRLIRMLYQERRSIDDSRRLCMDNKTSKYEK